MDLNLAAKLGGIAITTPSKSSRPSDLNILKFGILRDLEGRSRILESKIMEYFNSERKC